MLFFFSHFYQISLRRNVIFYLLMIFVFSVSLEVFLRPHIQLLYLELMLICMVLYTIDGHDSFFNDLLVGFSFM